MSPVQPSGGKKDEGRVARAERKVKEVKKRLESLDKRWTEEPDEENEQK